MNEQAKIFEISKGVEFNEKAEAQAVYDYSEFLRSVMESDIDDTDKKYIESVITEIISDELNHQQKLHALYTSLTGIKANKD